ncbi:hypothetical protein G4228_004516 [Cervus hanglu yarkandensis]|nr:hypothetical protein G4228_004516 [Cervus hanglu yarkandensis]
MGGQSAGPQHTEAETIQKLCDRVASSTLLDDRRNAVRALKSLSKKYRLEVGIQAMEHLIHVLQTDRSDSEIIGYALDTLYNIISNDEEEEVEENSTRQSEDLGSQFTEIFIKQQENVTLLLSLLEEFDFHVRWPGVKLLTSLLKQLGPQVQQIILVSPMGIVVEDCLILLQNLLKNNNSNQNFFKEGSYIQRMKPWFEVGDENSGWSAQKVTNLHLMLQLVRVLVSPNNPPGATSSCQKAMFQCGLLQQLCTILMATGVPADILTETINTVSEVIRGCQVNQDYFASVNAPSNPPREKLKQLIEKRIGKENFIEKLGFISKHELYSRASQKPQPNFPSPEYMIFDHEFTKLVKELEGVITKAIYKSSEEDKKEEEVKKTLEQHDSIVTHYKNMIREQDLQLEELKQQISTLKCQNEQLQTAVTQQISQIQQHKDQYNLLKVQLGKDSQHQGPYSDGAQMNGVQPEEISRLREEIEELKSNRELLQSQLAEKDSLIENLELATLKSQLNTQSVEITKLQAEKQELLQKTEAFAKSAPVPGESETVIATKTTDVEGRLSALLQETKELKNEIKALSEERTAIKEQLDSSNSTIAILQNEKNKLEVDITDSKKEQDDLLVLLADQDQKIFSLKNKLKELGHPVEEEDELESGDQDDEDDEDEDDGKEQGHI